MVYIRNKTSKLHPLIHVNPLKLLVWTFRRSPDDVIELYNTLSPVMQLATGGSMLNFGLWDGTTDDPRAAQRRLCDSVGELAELHSAKKLIDVGSGLGEPASHWMTKNGSIEKLVPLNLNYRQLAESIAVSQSYDLVEEKLVRINATSLMLPLPGNSADRIIALESAQHFRPLAEFIRECRRVLSPGGIMVLAIPVTKRAMRGLNKLMRLGILSLTWSSEHYSSDDVRTALTSNGFRIAEIISIGRQVYEPLTEYYIRNRESIRQKILMEYSGFVESVMFSSLLKMRKASQAGLIDYLIIKAV